MTDEGVYDPVTAETIQYFLATDANGEHVQIEFKTTNGGGGQSNEFNIV